MSRNLSQTTKLIGIPNHLRLTNRYHLHQTLKISKPFSISTRAQPILEQLSILPTSQDPLPGFYDGKWKQGHGELLTPCDPADGKPIGPTISSPNASETTATILAARQAALEWRKKSKDLLASLITIEMGKIKAESLGEVEEAIQIFDYALGLSRMFGGKIISSERKGHVIQEIPNPLGLVGVISAFNFPCAVYGWNFGLSFITGNSTIWKPSPSTPLTAIATTKIITEVIEYHGLPGAIAALVCGGNSVGQTLVNDKGVDLVSFTGSEKVGKEVGQQVQARFGKTLLELGGNNALVVMPSASMDLALRATVFGAVGTAGQRCTTTRRLFLHESIAPQFLKSLLASYAQIATRSGHGLDQGTLICALHTPAAVQQHHACIEACKAAGGKVLFGGWFVEPTVVDWGTALRRVEDIPEIVRKESFSPVLHVGTFSRLEEAVEMTNSVDQALSSSLFSRNVGDLYHWTGPEGSRCGIVNVNAGTSGAEIGAGFGGNFHTGWGRESGGDAWKQYVRWSSCTINHSEEMPLAQGINFS
ncbi:Aldehyde/histidinol dehydrogenase [Melampsora americana]|nr:Aldehyde/histidinol dehydrogenase [Melampsora americana]